jgi:hypothetical protein
VRKGESVGVQGEGSGEERERERELENGLSTGSSGAQVDEALSEVAINEADERSVGDMIESSSQWVTPALIEEKVIAVEDVEDSGDSGLDSASQSGSESSTDSTSADDDDDDDEEDDSATDEDEDEELERLLQAAKLSARAKEDSKKQIAAIAAADGEMVLNFDGTEGIDESRRKEA